MPKPSRNTLYISLFPFLYLLWLKFVAMENLDDFFWVAIFASIGLIISISIKVIDHSINKIGINVLISLFFIILITLLWNYLFRFYSDNSDFKGNIFRGILYGFRAPFYGRLSPIIKLSNFTPALITSGLFITFILLYKKWDKEKLTRNILLLFAPILFISFAWEGSLVDTFSATNCHYKTFTEGLIPFPNWSTFLSTYTDKMSQLGAHNNHYPPGILLLLKIDQESFPYLLKSIVILAPIISLRPFLKILNHFSISISKQSIFIAFYISSISLLFLPGKSLSPIILPFVAYSFYYLFKAIDERSRLAILLCALSFSLYLFFSFSVFFFAFFITLSLLFHYYKTPIPLKSLLKPLLVTSVVSFFLYSILFYYTGFNIIECLFEAIKNEEIQMKSSGLDSIARYLLISSGNLLAYIGNFGLVIIAFILFWFFSPTKKTNLSPLLLSLSVSIVVFSFSSKFHLEVERIWIFISPFVFMFIIDLPIKLNKKKLVPYLKYGIILNMLYAIYFLIIMKDCT